MMLNDETPLLAQQTCETGQQMEVLHQAISMTKDVHDWNLYFRTRHHSDHLFELPNEQFLNNFHTPSSFEGPTASLASLILIFRPTAEILV